MLNGECNVLADGEKCDDTHCNPFIVIVLDDEIDFTSAIQFNTKNPSFNFTYISNVRSKYSKLSIELWSGIKRHDEDALKMAQWPLWHFLKTIRVGTIIRHLKPTRADGKNWARGGRGKFNDLLIPHYDSKTVNFESALMSDWGFYPLYKLTTNPRLEGKNWKSGFQNKVFLSSVWIPTKNPTEMYINLDHV